MQIRPSHHPATPPAPARARPGEPGLLVVQVDGLGHGQLQEALDRGLMPNLARRLQAGELEAAPYRCELPSQTGVAQGGLFYGSSAMPGNQWYDKKAGRRVNAVGSKDSHAVEEDLSRGVRGLVQGGTTYLSPFTGEADRAYISLSDLSSAREEGGTAGALRALAGDLGHMAWSLAVHPVQAVKTGVRFAAFAAREAWRRRQADIPREGLKEKVVPPLWNALNVVFFSDAATRGLTRRMADADPVLYVDFPAFDEMSHEYGPGPEAFGTLKAIDRNLEVLLQAADHDERPYNVVILSDHGQAPGVHFHDLYGHSLTETVEAMLPPSTGAAGGRPPVVAQDFGSGAHLYFNFTSDPVDRRGLDRQYPGLVGRLRRHPGLAFVVSRQGAATLIEGKQGAVLVEPGRVRSVGANPLAPFGDPAKLAREIHGLAHREHAGDLMVYGERVGGKLVDFSTLPFRGLHGGIGDGQDLPFVIHPATMPLDPARVERTADLYGQLAPHVPSP